MTEVAANDRSTRWSFEPDYSPLLDGLSSEQAGSIRELLREREQLSERYWRVVQMASDAIVITDTARQIAFANPAASALFGYSEAELLGMPVERLSPVEVREAVARRETAALAGEPQRYETFVLRAGGERRTVSVSSAPLRERDKITGVITSLRDVTEERRLAEQLLQREKLAAIGQLVSGVAHELNNPLTGIIAFTQLLQSSSDATAEQLDSIATICREAKRAAKIVSNLLLFARQRHPERAATDLNTVVLDTLELRRYVLRTQQVEVITDLDEALPETWADPFQLQQVMLNLITNAEQALRGHEGVKRITLRTRRQRSKLVVSVSDTGPGILPDQIDQVFNPFFTTKQVGEGTGLGLSISDGIVRQHGGQISVRSSPGQGTTFSIELPLTRAPKPSAKPEPALADGDASPRVFLVVDDELAIRTALARYLRKEGHVVDAVASGAEALALTRKRRYDGILLDLRMPDLLGEDVYASLRERDPEHARRVVFTTGDVQSDGARTFLHDAGRPYVAKPFTLATVTKLLCGVAPR
jgi:two-component system NtrC family sensor kinase